MHCLAPCLLGNSESTVSGGDPPGTAEREAVGCEQDGERRRGGDRCMGEGKAGGGSGFLGSARPWLEGSLGVSGPCSQPQLSIGITWGAFAAAKG